MMRARTRIGRSRRSRFAIASVVAASALLAGTMTAGPADARTRVPTTRVVVSGLNNPRQVWRDSSGKLFVAEAGAAAGYADTPEFAQRMDWIRTQTLRDMYMEKVVEEQLTDEAVRARYDEEVQKAGPREEVSASHILVATKEEADAILAELREGGDFAKIAEAYGLRAMTVKTRGEVVPAIEAARAHQGTVLIDFQVEQEDTVYPMVPAGADLHAMIRRPSALVETAADE